MFAGHLAFSCFLKLDCQELSTERLRLLRHCCPASTKA